MSLTESTISYADIDTSLAPIGGIDGLLMMLPALLGDLPPELLGRIAQGVKDGEPVDMRFDLPGSLTYVVHLRGSADAPRDSV